MSATADPGQLPSTGRRLPGIEGLRAVAAFSILALHTWAYGTGRIGGSGLAGSVLPNLSLGVTLFFTLSGFLLYRPFAASIARGEDLPGVGRYLRNRALRILPAYWVILLICALVLETTLVRDANGDLVVGGLTDPVDLLLTGLFIGSYGPDTFALGIGPAWTLSVEVAFYLVLPLLVLAAARLARDVRDRSRRVAVLLGPPLFLLVVGVAGKLVAGVLIPAEIDEGFKATWHGVVERGFLGQADLFACGMVAAVLHTEVVDRRLTLPAGWRGWALATALGILIVCAATFDQGQLTYLPQNTAASAAMALLLAVVVFPSPTARQPLLTRVLELRPIVWAGLISYSVFLWHEPVVRWLDAHGVTSDGWLGYGWNLTVMVVVVGILSTLTYRFVELPALRRKRRRASRATPMDAAQLEAAP